MSNRQFTWWRRFHTPISIPKKLMMHGASQLIQKIEAGEYDIDHLFLEAKLEDTIFEREVENIKSQPMFKRYTKDTQDDVINNMRKKTYKRKEIILNKHISSEYNIIESLYSELCKEFDLERDYIITFIDNFDGTLRELYYTLRAKSRDQEITKEEISLIPRYFREIPRHYLKNEYLKYESEWKDIMLLHNYVEIHGGFIKSVN
jgi:hypothetical protein